jgi:hypothetical protein
MTWQCGVHYEIMNCRQAVAVTFAAFRRLDTTSPPNVDMRHLAQAAGFGSRIASTSLHE